MMQSVALAAQPAALSPLLQRLDGALSSALGELALVQALEDLGEIELPSAAPQPDELSRLQPLGPLYLACELERAGVLTTAEQVAGLFASGAITQPLGAATPRIVQFWRGRNERLSANERQTTFAQVFEPEAFYPPFRQLCEAALALADNGDTHDIREEVGLAMAVRRLREQLFARSGGMVTFAATDILQAVRDATAFLREPALHAAFGVRSMWALVAASSEISEHQTRQHADMGAAGVHMLAWLAQPTAGQSGVMPPTPIYAAAQRWLMAYGSLSGPSA
ncbi:hypothetical protein ACTSKR_09760 [Chitinibacteraceae bacterium HSL-7]